MAKKALYFHPVKTERIVGMRPENTQALHDELLKHAVRDEFVYTREWKKGDVPLWDNRAALHRANFDDDPDEHRLLYRVLVTGEVPH